MVMAKKRIARRSETTGSIRLPAVPGNRHGSTLKKEILMTFLEGEGGGGMKRVTGFFIVYVGASAVSPDMYADDHEEHRKETRAKQGGAPR
jgi:hypothetical protein